MTNQLKVNGETMQEVGTTHLIVKKLLAGNKYARSSDKLLIKMVERYCKSQDLPIPSYETITRCRRKVQETQYQADPSTVQARKKKADDMKELMV